MKKILCLALMVLVVMNTAHANTDIYAQDLKKCLVSSLNEYDKKIIQQWIMQAMFAHPNLSAKNSYSTQEVIQNRQAVGRLFTRLLAKDCTYELTLTAYYDGENGINTAFEALGEFAMMDIISSPTVEQHVSSNAEYINMPEIERAIKKLAQ